MRYCACRFTEDIFAFLISLIFISEPITATLGVYRAHPLGADYCANGTAAAAPPDPTANATATATADNSTLAMGASNVTLPGKPSYNVI